MNSINRNNYELYFIDFIDGALAPDIKLELDEFLLKNPDLKLELDLMMDSDVALLPDVNLTMDKAGLKKTESIGSDNAEVFNQQCIARLEGDLTLLEQSDFDKYIKVNNDKASTYALFAKTKLVPDANILFANKGTIKRLAIISITHAQFSNIRAIAAALIVMLFSYALFTNFTEGNKVHFSLSDDHTSVRTVNTTSEKLYAHDVRLHSPLNKNHEISVQQTGSNILPKIIPVYERTDVVPNKLMALTNTTVKGGQFIEDQMNMNAIQYNFESSPEPAILLANNENSNSTAPLTVAEYATTVFKKQVLNQADEQINPKGIKLSEIADAGLKGISTLTDNKVIFKKDVSEDGRLLAFAFDAGFLGFSRTSGKK